jgi:putative spermidine/putrescine transport system ATP-binding protein
MDTGAEEKHRRGAAETMHVADASTRQDPSPISDVGAPDYLVTENLEVTYGGVRALQDVSLRIRTGEFFCLLGPSGCGKSTTLNVIAGFLTPTHGRVVLSGQDVTTLTPQRREIGIVFQSYALFPHMNVVENIGYGLRLRKVARGEIARRVGDLLALVRLEGKGDRYPRQLSGGEQQRVAIARALAISPRLLLLDEPLSNLDARLREEMRGELKRIQRTTGVTTVFVTHDQEEAFGVADRVAVMNRGWVEQLGSPAEIYRHPTSHFVANFIGRSNRIACTVDPARPDILQAGSRTFRHAGRTPGPAGSHVLYLRPEDIRLGRPGPNAVAGRIAEVTYVGTLVNYRIGTEIGDLTVCELGGDGPPRRLGEDIEASWSVEAGSLLPEDAQ